VRIPLLAALAALFAACSSSTPCQPDAGDGLASCHPLQDGGSADCSLNEACAPFAGQGQFRCVPFCDSAGRCSQPNTICSAVAVGLCSVPDAGDSDAGEDAGPSCVTDFLCYPNRCGITIQ
jgi:hypothetical protein